MIHHTRAGADSFLGQRAQVQGVHEVAENLQAVFLVLFLLATFLWKIGRAHV